VTLSPVWGGDIKQLLIGFGILQDHFRLSSIVLGSRRFEQNKLFQCGIETSPSRDRQLDRSHDNQRRPFVHPHLYETGARRIGTQLGPR